MIDGKLHGVDWFKSSYSNSSGGACVEVGRWRKSTYSNSAGGDCVEVQDGIPDLVPVRDSKNPEGPALAFSAESWTSFIAAVKAHHFPV